MSGIVAQLMAALGAGARDNRLSKSHPPRGFPLPAFRMNALESKTHPQKNLRSTGGRLNSQPLVVDLDGTLIHTDMLHESTLRMLRDSPWDLVRISVWLAKGKAVLKQHLAMRTRFDPEHLPYNRELLAWLEEQKRNGRQLILCTASDTSIALTIAKHLGIFDEVIASDGIRNLAGVNKAASLVERFGKSGFDYVGNSTADLAVWQYARRAIVVNAPEALTRKAGRLCDLERVFLPRQAGAAVWGRALRVHQWLKNLLLFVPILAAHRLSSPEIWTALAWAFASFSLCASSIYIFNDLLDLESDRAHPRKRARPFASGHLPVWQGVALSGTLLAAGFGLGTHVGGSFLPWLVFYFALTCLYSWVLKRMMLLDCLALAMLYTLRIVAGAAAAGLGLSFWLLAFAVFLFLSLAFVKRYAELELQLLSGKEKAHGRGYYTSDAPVIQTLGIAAGYGAVLVLALYLNSDAVVKLYRTPELMWGAVPILLFWVSRMWMKAHRGLMHDDPLVFAVKDKASVLCGIALAIVLTLGTIGLPL